MIFYLCVCSTFLALCHSVVANLRDNSADGNYEVRYKCNVLIYSSGTVMWVPPAIYQVKLPCMH